MVIASVEATRHESQVSSHGRGSDPAPGRAVTRRALLIGSQVHGLRGVDNDLDEMIRVLPMWGFQRSAVAVCRGALATRDGILSSIAKFIAATAPGDAVLLYYAGHGCRAENMDLAGTTWRGGRRLPDFIVPVDFDDSAEGDFRGILSLELSMSLAQLAQKTPNITVIMDCCHSGTMVRSAKRQVLRTMRPGSPGAGAGADPDSGSASASASRDKPIERYLPRRSLFSAAIPGLGNHLLEVHADPRMALLPAGHDRAGVPVRWRWVRVLACEGSHPAYEIRDSQKRWRGAMTHALIELLEGGVATQGDDDPGTGHSTGDAGDARVSPLLNWQAVEIAMRSMVRHTRRQTPRIEGPHHRYLFELAEQTTWHLAGVRPLENGEFRIESGELLDTRIGDVYGIWHHRQVLGSPSRDHCVAWLQVARVLASYSIARPIAMPERTPGLAGRLGGGRVIGRQQAIRGGEIALLIHTERTPRPVRIEAVEGAPDSIAGALGQAIDGSMFVRPASRLEGPEGSQGDPGCDLPIIRASDTGLELRDSRERLVRAWTRIDQGLEELVRATERLVRAEAFVALAGPSKRPERNAYYLDRRYAIDWGRVIDGRREPFGPGAVEIRAGERVCVRIENRDEIAVYASVYAFRATGRVALLGTEYSMRIAAGEEWVIGQYEGRDRGVELAWPDDAVAEPGPCGERRIAERLVIVLSDRRLDLRGLIQDTITLESMRESRRRQHDDLHYRVEILDYTLRD